MKRLIINADDFGFTKDVNAGIVHAHRDGVLTSTTLMATGDAFDDAVRLARETPTLDVGAHLVLVQGRSAVTNREFPRKPRDTALAVLRGQLDPYRELRAQIEQILAAGVHITHLDSHKHTHIIPRVFRAVVRLAQQFQIPYLRLPLDLMLPIPGAASQLLRRYYLRLVRNANVKLTDHFLGFRLTGSLTERTLASALPLVREGVTELMCHPGFLGTDLKAAETRLRESRVQELQALTSPRIRQLIREQGIDLTSFGH